MDKPDYSFTILSDKSPEVIYQILLNVRAWWSGLYEESFTGQTEKLNDVFSFKAGGGAHYTEQKLVELVANKKIVWLVTAANLTFLENTAEWVGTQLIFEISEAGDKNEVKFTHQGLLPTSECYDNCAPAWTQYMQTKLLPLLTL